MPAGRKRGCSRTGWRRSIADRRQPGAAAMCLLPAARQARCVSRPTVALWAGPEFRAIPASAAMPVLRRTAVAAASPHRAPPGSSRRNPRPRHGHGLSRPQERWPGSSCATRTASRCSSWSGCPSCSSTSSAASSRPRQFRGPPALVDRRRPQAACKRRLMGAQGGSVQNFGSPPTACRGRGRWRRSPRRERLRARRCRRRAARRGRPSRRRERSPAGRRPDRGRTPRG